jgi:hypothetical protein
MQRIKASVSGLVRSRGREQRWKKKFSENISNTGFGTNQIHYQGRNGSWSLHIAENSHVFMSWPPVATHCVKTLKWQVQEVWSPCTISSLEHTVRCLFTEYRPG